MSCCSDATIENMREKSRKYYKSPLKEGWGLGGETTMRQRRGVYKSLDIAINIGYVEPFNKHVGIEKMHYLLR